MADLFIRKLQLYVRLSVEERDLLTGVAEKNVRRIAARRDVLVEGELPRSTLIILDGWAARTKLLSDGRRQIVSILLPGDVCDAHGYVLREMDHSIVALTRLRIADVSRERLEELTDRSPRLCRAFWWQDLVGMAIQREWTLNLGQRSAFERIGHFLCETFVRLEALGLTQGNSCDFPIVQNDLADITGLTSVHVNRTLQELRRSGLIVLHNRRLTIPDLDRLKSVGLFTANYLHLEREGAELDANP